MSKYIIEPNTYYTTADYRKVLGFIVSKARKKREYTQEELGLVLGVSRSYMCHFESGRRKISVDTFDRLCLILSISPSSVISQVENIMGEHINKRIPLSRIEILINDNPNQSNQSERS